MALHVKELREHSKAAGNGLEAVSCRPFPKDDGQCDPRCGTERVEQDSEAVGRASGHKKLKDLEKGSV